MLKIWMTVFLFKEKKLTQFVLRGAILAVFFFAMNAFALPGSSIIVEGDFSDAEKEELLHADSVDRISIENRIVARLENTGYPAAQIVEESLKDTLKITLRKGDGYVFGMPRNGVKTKSSKEVFAKLTGIKSGAPFQRDYLVRATKKMERTGYFVQLKDPEIYRDQNRNKLVPLFYMQDASLSYAEGIVSYSSEDDSWVGSIDVSLKNLLGTARDLQLQGSTGDGEHYVDLRYKEPWLLQSEWNGLVRGSLKDDSTYTDAHLQLGVERAVNFEWTFALLGGIGGDYWSSTIELGYQDLDSYILPRHGRSFETSLNFKRSRDSSQYILAYEAVGENYVPVYGNIIARTAFAGGYLYPTNKTFENRDLFSLGGVRSWKGFRPDFLKTRAYGNAEFAIRYQGLERTAFEAFYEPGLYHGSRPLHGWIAEHQYGLGVVQYRDSFSVSIYYALRPGLSAGEGLLHLGVKTLF